MCVQPVTCFAQTGNGLDTLVARHVTSNSAQPLFSLHQRRVPLSLYHYTGSGCRIQSTPVLFQGYTGIEWYRGGIFDRGGDKSTPSVQTIQFCAKKLKKYFKTVISAPRPACEKSPGGKPDSFEGTGNEISPRRSHLTTSTRSSCPCGSGQFCFKTAPGRTPGTCGVSISRGENLPFSEHR